MSGIEVSQVTAEGKEGGRDPMRRRELGGGPATARRCVRRCKKRNYRAWLIANGGKVYRARLKGFGQVWRNLFLLMLTTSA